jgi:c-di-AMP phosphodiesterase-like protein
VAAYIVLDNLAELAQYVKVDYRRAANNIELHLKEWADELGGVLCQYDRDKYLLFFAQEKLEYTIENNFPILNKIRSEELGDGHMSITVSMGISAVGSTVSEREQNAQLALDTALRRGGDQIVIKKESSMDFFGGRSKSIQKGEKVSSRVIADHLARLIREHSKVMIMGHKNPDCDSVGACIGMARFVKGVGGFSTSVRIVIDTNAPAFKACAEPLLSSPEYKNVFISGPSALDQITADTLLIIVDANNFNIIESSDVAKSLSDIVVIDHHRKVSDFTRPLLIEYIDPSASSASELVSEMIESELTENALLYDEANVLLSGIMLDTMNFTRTTGIRTFSAACFLRAAGASSEKARSFFEDDIIQHLAEAKFFMPENVTIYRENLAIAISLGTDEKYDRVAASKAAERLITVRKVDAAFALVKIGDSIHISARSTGTINVQLILEKLKGGGHFDSAGAQVNGRTMNEVLVILKSAINEYIDG